MNTETNVICATDLLAKLYTAERTARIAMCATEACTDKRAEAVEIHTAAEDALSEAKQGVRVVFAPHEARRIIRVAKRVS